jgi:hypothetical protein
MAKLSIIDNNNNNFRYIDTSFEFDSKEKIAENTNQIFEKDMILYQGLRTHKRVYPKARIPKSASTEKRIYRKARIPKSTT